MTIKGSPEWHRQRRERDAVTPPAPMRPLKELLQEALERLTKLKESK